MKESSCVDGLIYDNSQQDNMKLLAVDKALRRQPPSSCRLDTARAKKNFNELSQLLLRLLERDVMMMAYGVPYHAVELPYEGKTACGACATIINHLIIPTKQ